MTFYFDTVADFMSKLPEAALTRDVIRAWSHGLTLRRQGIDDISDLIDGVMSKTEFKDIDDLFAQSIAHACSFTTVCGETEVEEIRSLLYLYHVVETIQGGE